MQLTRSLEHHLIHFQPSFSAFGSKKSFQYNGLTFYGMTKITYFLSEVPTLMVFRARGGSICKSLGMAALVLFYA